jgi:large repetitive protein
MKIALPFRSLLLLLLLSLSLQGLQAQQSIALPVICAECPANAALGSSGSINVDTDLPACLISVNGTYIAGNALGAGNNIVITLQVNATGAYSLTTNSVNGFSFSGSGTFSGTGNQQVTLSGSGTPTASGVTGFVLQAGNTNCAFNVNVGGLAPNPPNLNPSNGALLTGTAEPNRTILIDVNGDGNPDYVTVSDGSGNFSQVLNPALPNGTVIAARARDGAGNTSSPASVTVDAQAPAAPVLNASNGSVLTGTAEPNSTVLIDVNGDNIPDFVTTADGSGNFSQPFSPALANGTVITARARDAAGNTSAPASVTVDAQAPAAPVLNASNGSVLTGTAEPNSTVLIDVNGDGTPDFTTTADGSGNFSQPFSPALANGTVIAARARDAAGNTSAPASVTVDAQAPAAPVLDPSDGTLISGTAEPGSTILIDVNNDGTPDYTTVADNNGNFSQAISPALAGGTLVSVVARDEAGNNSAPATLTTTAPPGLIASLNCAGATNNGSLTAGVAASGVSSSVPYTGGNGNAHSGQTVASTGVTGLTATLAAGSFANGAGNLIYTITGTPGASGTASFALNIGGQSCTLTRGVDAAPVPGRNFTNGFQNNSTCINKEISVTPCSVVTGASINDNAATTLGIEYDWTFATNITRGIGFGASTNTQSIVQIGGQCWARFNLNIAPTAPCADAINTGCNTWTTSSPGDIGSWGYYNTTVINGTSGWATTEPATNEGLLYQWSAAMNSSTTERAQGVCPTGWHIPSDCEWMYLEHQLGMSVAEQQQSTIRSTGSVGSKLSTLTISGNNSSGFTALFTGARNSNLPFGGRETTGFWWSSSRQFSSPYRRGVQSTSDGVSRGTIGAATGSSVRCLKD